jgi:sulfur relay (sulfurtransferase) DsrC/TusE family protein
MTYIASDCVRRGFAQSEQNPTSSMVVRITKKMEPLYSFAKYRYLVFISDPAKKRAGLPRPTVERR